MPEGVAGLFNFVEEQEAQLQLLRMALGQLFLRDQGMGLAVPQVAWRRANQLGNFVRVLELRAIYLYDRARISKEDFRGSFHNAGFSGAGRSQEQKIAHRASRRIQPCAKDLEHVHKGLHAFFLSHDLGTQGGMKITRVVATDARIQLLTDGGPHCTQPFLASNLPQTQCASQPCATLR